MEEVGFRMPVLEVLCRYLKPARCHDELVIDTVLAGLGRASLRFECRVVRRADGELPSCGMTRHCFLDTAGRPVHPPAFFAELLERVTRHRASGSMSTGRLRAGARSEPSGSPCAVVAERMAPLLGHHCARAP